MKMNLILLFQISACFGYGLSAASYRSHHKWVALAKAQVDQPTAEKTTNFPEIRRLRMMKNRQNFSRQLTARFRNFYRHHKNRLANRD